MQPEQSDILRDETEGGERIETVASALSISKRLLMLVINYVPLLHAVGVGLLVALPWTTPGRRIAAGLGALYLIPPLAALAVRLVSPIRGTRLRVGGREYFTWWTLFSLQAVFCRLPMLEECLRLVPGLYSLWLRLWGSRIGRLTYWGAGLRVLDRSFLRIGDDVAFGAAVRLNPHVLARNDRGELELILAPVTVGDRVIVGGYSLLTAGTVIEDDECTHAFLISPPFSRWRNDRRVRERETTP